MKKQYVNTMMIVVLVLFVIGIGMILKSTEIGEAAGSKSIRARGGSMDTELYHFVIESTAEKYEKAGVVLASLGGFGILLCGLGIYKEL